MKYLTRFFPLIAFLLNSCVTITSTGSRYHNDKNTTEIKVNKNVETTDTILVSEDFDITPYRAKIEMKDTNFLVSNRERNNLNV
jgi:hypothetical protein